MYLAYMFLVSNVLVEYIPIRARILCSLTRIVVFFCYCCVLCISYTVFGHIDMTSPTSVLRFVGDKVCVAHDSVYTLYDVYSREPLSLVAKDDPNMRFLFTMKVR